MDNPEPGWRSPEMLLMVMTAAAPLSSATWLVLINNFAVEVVELNGAQFGMLQSIREIPGFLMFAIVFALLLLREQSLAVVSLLILGVGVAMTGFFPQVFSLYCVTVLMSIGFHSFETVQQSLSLQWIPKARTPYVLGKLIAARSFSSLLAFGLIYLCLTLLDWQYRTVYLVGGGVTCLIAVVVWLTYPHFPSGHEQHTKPVLRMRYWLFYMLTMLSGARRQIFVVFAGFLMVEKFGYSASALTLLFLINCAINIWLAPRIGKLVMRWGERHALVLEYIGLIGVFVGYALVENAGLAALLYVLDHMFFALAIAMKSYFQKIANPADIASTAGVSFTINHIAAVILPAVLGVVWLTSPAAVFLCGAAIAAMSLVCSMLVPDAPQVGNETRLARRAASA